MVGTWIYDATNNIITVTGGTEGAPAGFADAWNADKAGTFNLNTNPKLILVSPGWDTDKEVRPAESLALRLTIIISSYVSGDTVIIEGLDARGYFLSNAITITGNGTYQTPLIDRYYKQIDKVYGLPGSNFYVQVQQPRWGVVWKQATNQYAFDAKLQIGDGSTTTWFADYSKQIWFSSLASSATDQNLILVKSAATFRSGLLNDLTDKSTSQGISFGSTQNYRTRIIMAESGGVAYLYHSSFISTSNQIIRIIGASGSTVRLWNCQLLRYAQVADSVGIDIYNLVAAYIYAYGGVIASTTGTFNKINVFWNTYAFQLFGNLAFTIQDVIVRDTTYIILTQSVRTISSYLINVDSDTWAFSWSASDTGKVYRQYEFDLTATYPNGTAFQGATVTIKHYGQGGGTDYTGTTNSNGEIATQTLTNGFYNQTGGNTIYSYNPYNIAITSTTMQPINMNFTLSDKTVWNLPLKFNVAPVAVFKYGLKAEVGESVTLDASESIDSDGSITNYSWNFGDGSTTSGATATSVTHVWITAGTYTITLTVTDDQGKTDSTTQTIVISVGPEGGVSGPILPPDMRQPDEPGFVSNVHYVITSYPNGTLTYNPLDPVFEVKFLVTNYGGSTVKASFYYSLTDANGTIFWNSNSSLTLSPSEQQEITVKAPMLDSSGAYYLWIQMIEPTILQPSYIGFVSQSFLSFIFIPVAIISIVGFSLMTSGYSIHIVQKKRSRVKPRTIWDNKTKKRPKEWE